MDVRTRFGIVPPPPLDSMRQGDLELSDIALPDTKNDSVKIAEPDEGLLHHISGPMHFDAAHRRIGLYWQSYGVSATHSAPDASPVATRRRAEEGAGRRGNRTDCNDWPRRALSVRDYPSSNPTPLL